MYVDDDTDAGKCANNTRSDHECFFQVLAIHNIENEHLMTKSMYFSDNLADIACSTLYGGLLDRCAVSQFAEVNFKHWPGEDYEYPGNGLVYFSDVSDDANSSGPLQVCFCVSGDVKCTYQSHTVEVKKGEITEMFNLSLVAVDQTEHTINGIIQASLNHTESGLAEGQLTRKMPENALT